MKLTKYNWNMFHFYVCLHNETWLTIKRAFGLSKHRWFLIYFSITGRVDSGRLYIPICSEVTHMPHDMHAEEEKQHLRNYQHRYNQACGKCSFCWKWSCYVTPVSFKIYLNRYKKLIVVQMHLFYGQNLFKTGSPVQLCR